MSGFDELKAAVLEELEQGTHTEAFADGARFALQEAARMVVVTDREALEKLVHRFEDLAGPEREFDGSRMSLREEGRTGAYRLAARELRSVLATVAPRPVIDREALDRRLETAKGYSWSIDSTVDAVMELARPMPTREQIVAALRKRLVDSNFNDNLHEPIRSQTIDVWADALAGAVVLLLDGAQP